jgi:hypothetical protein
MLKRIFVRKKDKMEDRGNDAMTFILHKILLGYEREIYEMGGACGTHERDDK